MIKQNSSGYAQPRQKTLDVEVNLLAEWSARRAKRHEDGTRVLTYLVVLMCAAVVTLPLLRSIDSTATSRAASAASKARNAAKLRMAAESRLRDLEPEMDTSTFTASLHAGCNRFFGETAAVMNAADSFMAFSSVRSDVVGAKMTIRCQADAASSQTAQKFVAAAGKGAHVVSSLLAAMRRNAAFGPDAVGLEYIKVVEVGK